MSNLFGSPSAHDIHVHVNPDGVHYPLTLNEYQSAARQTAIYPGSGEVDGLIYATLGLSGEAGEIANKVKKVLRDNDGIVTDEVRAALGKELGDVLWYVAQLAYELRSSLEDVANANLDKLMDRKNRGTLGGSGDVR